MGIHRPFAALTVLFCSLLRHVGAERECGRQTSYGWAIRDAQYEAAAPETSVRGGYAYVAASVVPTDGQYASFQCFAEWPVAWDGWYEGGSSQLVWADCVNTAAGSNLEKAVSFAVDWRRRVLYLAHTFGCSDRYFDTLATGSIALSLECVTGREGEKRCAPKATSEGNTPSIGITTAQVLSGPEASGCPGSARAYYSWQVEDWRRRYQNPSMTSPGIGATPIADAGPSFKLYAMATGETFTCSPSGGQEGVFEGSCKRGSDFSRTTAKFRFDPNSHMLNVTQYWNCGNSTTFEASGAGYIQPMCNQNSSNRIVDCASARVWIGSKAF